MEAAVQKERERTRAMEKEEANLSADELRAVLKRERHRMARLAADLAAMRSMAVQSVAQAEVHEEGRINHLMRRLDTLQAEKGRIIVELEREEEMVRTLCGFFFVSIVFCFDAHGFSIGTIHREQLTNNLQKKLNESRAMLEQQKMSRSDLEARLAALQVGAGDINMSEELEEKEEEELEEAKGEE